MVLAFPYPDKIISFVGLQFIWFHNIYFITSENNIYEYNKLSISYAAKSTAETGFKKSYYRVISCRYSRNMGIFFVGQEQQ